MNDKAIETGNPLGYKEISPLLRTFAIPSIISGLINAIYNIVDQIFIGQSIGILGNSATNVSFPIVTLTTALALLLGIGTASNFSLELGKGNQKKAMNFLGNGVVSLISLGIILTIFILIFLNPLLNLFGATKANFALAKEYTSITSFGIPFSILIIGGAHLIRADGSPKYAMIAITTGAVLNCFLDPLFIFGFGWGISGAAYATITGQIISGLAILYYYFHFKTGRLTKEDLVIKGSLLSRICAIGGAACINQLAIAAVQIVMNNTLRTYGANSIYGADIPLACVGIISKVNVIYISIMVGIAQGCQPIFGFNYGAGKYKRVRDTFFVALKWVLIISTAVFICFQLFPRQIVSIFGEGSDAYFQFSERYLRIYNLLIMIAGVQILCSNFFSSIGKAQLGIILTLTRQAIFLIPLILILPIFFGINGVMFSGPIADGVAGIIAFYFTSKEMKKMKAAKTV